MACMRLLTGKRRLRKIGLVILLAVCFTTGTLVWRGRTSTTDSQTPLRHAQREHDSDGGDTQRRSEAGPAGESRRGEPLGGLVAVERQEERKDDRASPQSVSLKVVSPSPSESIDPSCLIWCRRGNDAKPPYFLTVVLLVRIYYVDPAKLTTREMLQWLAYLRYAGVEHVYVYDAYIHKNESQVTALKPFLDNGYVTYVDWSHKAYPYTIQGTQVAAYGDCMRRWGKDTVWQAAIDIDEYPFSKEDTGENFLARFIRTFSAKWPDAAEITMQNFLFLGKPLSETKHPLLVDRMYRRTHAPANALVKPIYMPARLSGAQVWYTFYYTHVYIVHSS